MSMPGFTAAHSLCGAREQYRMIRGFGALNAAVMPQARVVWVCIRTRTGDLSCIRVRLPEGPVLA